MPLNPTSVLPAQFWAVEYDGTNADDIAAWIRATVTWADTNLVSLMLNMNEVLVRNGDRVIGTAHNPGYMVDVVKAADYTTAWAELP